ncbi:MAG: LLM class flavin-dependent oxidoreductase [Chloroflexota bacterium]
MKFGITIPPEGSLRDYIQWARLAEESGFELLGVTDSQSIRRELYATMAAVALNTRRIRFGPRVTNPITRHPAVAASALATVEEVAPGRVMAAVGSGFSSIENLGERPASLAQLREYIETIRGLHTSGVASYRGRTVRLTWARPRIPLFLAAHGPKTLQLAGEIADGVVVGTGVLPEVVADSLARIRIGAERSGRRLEDLDIWWFVVAYIASDRATAIDRVRTSLAGLGHGLARFTTEGKFIPPELVRPIQALYQAYATEEHVVTGAIGETRHNAQLLEDLGLKDYLAERFAIAGTAEECVARLRRIREAGVNKVWISIHFPEKVEFMERWSREVMPMFGSAGND